MLLIAAGLLSTSMHEFQEAKLLPVICDHVYDLSKVINQDSITGGILKSLFGYNASPSLLEVVIYTAYIAIMLIIISKFFQIKKIKKTIVKK